MDAVGRAGAVCRDGGSMEHGRGYGSVGETAQPITELERSEGAVDDFEAVEGALVSA